MKESGVFYESDSRTKTSLEGHRDSTSKSDLVKAEVCPYGHDSQEKSNKSEKKVEISKQKDSIRSTFHNFLREVTINGIKYTVLPSASSYRKLLWTCLVACGFALALAQVTDRVKYFKSRPTELHATLEHAPELRFPTVTFCPENMVVRRKALDIGGPELVEMVEKSLSPGPSLGDGPAFNYSMYNFTGVDFGALYNNLSQHVDEALIMCEFDGVECNSSNFVQINTNLGYCFQFNHGVSRYKTLRAGALYGLKMILFVEQDEYLVQVPGSVSAGFRIALHPSDEIPLMREWSFRISPNEQTHVSVTVHKKVKAGPPYSNCSNKQGYSYNDCIGRCEAAYIMNQCGCKDRYMPGNAPVCNPEEFHDCFSSECKRYIQEHMVGSCPCPKACETVRYTYTTSSAVASEMFLDHLAPILQPERNDTEAVKAEIRRDYAMVEIFFSEVAYQRIETVPAYNVMALMCDIGGALGLVLGSTFLTIFEICDFLCVLVWNSKTLRKSDG